MKKREDMNKKGKNMKKLILSSFLAFAIICSGSAYAEVTPNINEGTKQLSLNGMYDANHALDYQLTLGGGFSYFVMDSWQIGGVVGWSSNDLADSLELGIVTEYDFNTGSPWVPFVKAGILYAGVELDDDVYNNSGEADFDTWIGRLGAGCKYFFRDDIAVSLALNYDKAGDDLYFDDEGDVDDYNIKAVLGLEFYFD